MLPCSGAWKDCHCSEQQLLYLHSCPAVVTESKQWGAWTALVQSGQRGPGDGPVLELHVGSRGHSPGARGWTCTGVRLRVGHYRAVLQGLLGPQRPGFGSMQLTEWPGPGQGWGQVPPLPSVVCSVGWAAAPQCQWRPWAKHCPQAVDPPVQLGACGLLPGQSSFLRCLRVSSQGPQAGEAAESPSRRAG